MGSSMDCRDTATTSWCSSRPAGESQLQCLEDPCPLLLHWLGCVKRGCSTISPIFYYFLLYVQLLLPDNFPPNLNRLSQRCSHHCQWAQPWPAAGTGSVGVALAAFLPPMPRCDLRNAHQTCLDVQHLGQAPPGLIRSTATRSWCCLMSPCF